MWPGEQENDIGNGPWEIKNILTGPEKIGDCVSAEGVHTQRMQGTQERERGNYVLFSCNIPLSQTVNLLILL